MTPSAPLARACAPATLGLLVTAAFLLAGCGATSDRPLSDASSTTTDETLIGHWTCTERGYAEDRSPKAPRDLVVGRAKEADGPLEVVWLDLDADQRIRVQRLGLLPTRIDGRLYLSAREPGRPDEPWFLLRYAPGEEDTLEVWGLDPGPVAAEVEAGRIAGRVTGEGPGREVRLTAPTEALRAWVAKTPAAFDAARVTRFRRLPTD